MWHPHLKKNWLSENNFEIADHRRINYPAFLQLKEKDVGFLSPVENKKMQCNCRFLKEVNEIEQEQNKHLSLLKKPKTEKQELEKHLTPNQTKMIPKFNLMDNFNNFRLIQKEGNDSEAQESKNISLMQTSLKNNKLLKNKNEANSEDLVKNITKLKNMFFKEKTQQNDNNYIDINPINNNLLEEMNTYSNINPSTSIKENSITNAISPDYSTILNYLQQNFQVMQSIQNLLINQIQIPKFMKNTQNNTFNKNLKRDQTLNPNFLNSFMSNNMNNNFSQNNLLNKFQHNQIQNINNPFNLGNSFQQNFQKQEYSDEESEPENKNMYYNDLMKMIQINKLNEKKRPNNLMNNFKNQNLHNMFNSNQISNVNLENILKLQEMQNLYGNTNPLS